MPQVRTVRGPVDTAELGQVLMHEHVFVLTPVVQKVFAEEGVDPRRVVLGHSGDSDADHLSELADAGFVLGMDGFGINPDTTSCSRRTPFAG